MTESAFKLAEKTLREMIRWKVRPTPRNYHVWYTYVLGGNGRLSARMDSIKTSGRGFTDAAIGDIYAKCIDDGSQTESLEKAQRETQMLLKGLLAGILAAGESTSTYETSLREYLKELESDPELGHLKEVVGDIINDTSQATQSSAELRQRLEEAKEEAERLRRELDSTKEQAWIDALTGLPNRGAFDAKLEELFIEFKTERTPFSAVLMDIDLFKAFNNMHGHLVGDAVLRIVGNVLMDSVKGRDFVARYGGEEFIALLPLTKLPGAFIVADQIRDHVSKKQLKITETEALLEAITLSSGVAEVSRDDTPESLIERADKALYLAKLSGRNVVKSEMSL